MCSLNKSSFEINIFIVYSLRFHSLELMISISCYWLWLWILVEAYSIQNETIANSSAYHVSYKSSLEIDIFIAYSLRLDFLQLMISIQWYRISDWILLEVIYPTRDYGNLQFWVWFLHKSSLKIDIFTVYLLRFDCLQLMISIQCYWIWLWIPVDSYSIKKVTIANSSVKCVFYKAHL